MDSPPQSLTLTSRMAGNMDSSGHRPAPYLAAGSHEASLQMILDGQIEGSAIDSTVLELEIARRPALAGKIRVLDTIGPRK